MERKFCNKPEASEMAGGRTDKLLTKMRREVAMDICLTPVRSNGKLKILASLLGLTRAGEKQESRIVNLRNQNVEWLANGY